MSPSSVLVPQVAPSAAFVGERLRSIHLVLFASEHAYLLRCSEHSAKLYGHLLHLGSYIILFHSLNLLTDYLPSIDDIDTLLRSLQSLSCKVVDTLLSGTLRSHLHILDISSVGKANHK